MSCCGRILIATLDHATAILILNCYILRPDHGYTNQINIIRKQSQKVDLIWRLNCCLWDVRMNNCQLKNGMDLFPAEKIFQCLMVS